MTSIELQRCRACEQDLPATSEHFSPHQGRLNKTCKPCRAAAARQQRAEGPAAQARKVRDELYASGYQACQKCGAVKPANAEHFYAAPGSRYGLETTCRSCRLSQYASLKDRDPEHREKRRRQRTAQRSRWTPEVKARKHQQRKLWRSANPERDREAERLRRLKDPDRARAAQRDYWHRTKARRLELAKAWRLRNPLKYRAAQHAARARKRNAEGTYTGADVEAKLRAQGGKCYWCGTPLQLEGKNKFQVDHLIALARGGTNHPNNIVCACRPCNNSKGPRMPWQFNGRLL